MDWARIAGAAGAVAVLASQAVHLDYADRPASLAIGILGVEVLAIGDIAPAAQPSAEAGPGPRVAARAFERQRRSPARARRA